MSKVSTSILKSKLNLGVHRFNFRKKDGSIRNALGTRNTDLIPNHLFILEVDDISKKSVVFYDLEAEDFRSLSVGTEVALIS